LVSHGASFLPLLPDVFVSLGAGSIQTRTTTQAARQLAPMHLIEQPFRSSAIDVAAVAIWCRQAVTRRERNFEFLKVAHGPRSRKDYVLFIYRRSSRVWFDCEMRLKDFVNSLSSAGREVTSTCQPRLIPLIGHRDIEHPMLKRELITKKSNSVFAGSPLTSTSHVLDRTFRLDPDVSTCARQAGGCGG
jgi:hypothetical protein